MNYSIKNEDIKAYNDCVEYGFPKYTSQLMNLANQNAQGTRPIVVGQLSELFPEYLATGEEVNIDSWRNWYLEKYPNAFNEATDRIFTQINNLQKAITLIDKDMIKNFVEELIINKTFNGMYLQKAILASLAEKKNSIFRLATPEEESKGIDGYVDDTPYSVKPDTYKMMGRLSENIDVKMIYYTKTKTGIKVEVEE